MSVEWNGRTFGELTPQEKLDAAHEAFKQLEQEFTEHGDKIFAALELPLEDR